MFNNKPMTNKPTAIQTVHNIGKLLRCFTEEEGELGVMEFADNTEADSEGELTGAVREFAKKLSKRISAKKDGKKASKKALRKPRTPAEGILDIGIRGNGILPMFDYKDWLKTTVCYGGYARLD